MIIIKFGMGPHQLMTVPDYNWIIVITMTEQNGGHVVARGDETSNRLM